MPRYYFDFDDGERATRDIDGNEFADLEMVRNVAIRALPEIASDELPNGNLRVFSVQVRDEEDRRIFKAELAFKAEWLI